MAEEKESSGHGESGLQLYSLAIVTMDKPDASDLVEASPMEQLPFSEGPIKDNNTEYKTEAPNSKGVPKSSKAKAGRTVTAKWYDISGGNRVTAPDVYKGETILLLRYADMDQYYWCKVGREPSLRRLETIQFAASNVKGGGEYDKNTSYWVEISTKQKYIHIHTSNNDGEPFSYDIKLDTGAGKFTFEDSNTNRIEIDSAQNLMTIDMDVHILRKLTVDNATKLDNTLDVAEATTVNGHATMTSGMTVSNSTGGAGGTMSGGFNLTGSLTVTDSISAGGSIHGNPVTGCAT